MEEIIGTQVLTPEEQELLDEIYERLDVFEEENRPYHDAAKVAREVVRLKDPDQTGGKEKILQLQTLKSTINNVVADQMQNMPEPRLLPETPDKEDLARDLQDVVHYILYTQNDYEAMHQRRSEDFYETGTAITQIAWDPDMNQGKGDIAVLRWPLEAFLWDPQAEDIQDARALMKVSWHPKSWYDEHYPDVSPYIESEEGSHSEVGLPEARRALNSGDEQRVMLIEYWYRKYNAKSHKYTINVAYAAGHALISHHKNVYKHGMYPFVLDVHSKIEGSPVGDGLVTELRPMMQYINRYAHYIDINLRMSSKGRMLTRRNSGIDRKALADYSQDIIEGDSVVQGEDWNWIQHAPFNAMIANQMLQFQSDLKQDAGANQFTRGETTGGIVSGKAIGFLQEAGGKIANMRTGTMNAGFKKIVEQILWLMSEFYKEDRVVLITGNDGRNRQVPINAQTFFGGKLPAPPYTVSVEVQKRNPAQVAAQNEQFMNAYTMAAQAQQYFPLSSLFRILNIEGKDRLLPIIEANEQKQDMMRQLQAQNDQLMSQNEQLQKENQNLRGVTNRMNSALSSMAANGRSMLPNKMAEAGPSPQDAMVDMSHQALVAMPDG